MSELFKFLDREAEVFDMEDYRRRTNDLRWASPSEAQMVPQEEPTLKQRLGRLMTGLRHPWLTLHHGSSLEKQLEPYETQHTSDVTPISNPAERVDDGPPQTAG